MFEFNIGDELPLDVSEGVRAYNIDSGEKLSFVSGEWRPGWYIHYIDIKGTMPVAGVKPEHMKGLPDDIGGMAGYVLTLNDDLTSWDLRPMETGSQGLPMYLTRAQLVSRIKSHNVEEGDIYRLTDESNKRIKVTHISLPGGEVWAQTMRSSGQLSHYKVQ